MTQLLGLSDGEFEITANNTLKAPVDKVGNVQDHTSSHGAEMEHERKDQIGVLEMLAMYTCLRWALSTARTKIRTPKGRRREIIQTNAKRKKFRIEHVKNFGTISNDLTYE